MIDLMGIYTITIIILWGGMILWKLENIQKKLDMIKGVKDNDM